VIQLKIPCSQDQLDVIEEFLLHGLELGIQPDERAWIIAHVKKQHPTGRVTSADLNLAEGEWVVQVELEQ
jgi:hypothetical protein